MLINRSKFTDALTDRHTVLPLIAMIVALGITAAAYAPGLSGPLLLDDFPQLQGMIDNSADDPEVLLNTHIISISGPLGRPVSMATFIGTAITHGPDIWWWKYENLLLHLITGLLIFWLTAMLLIAVAKPNQKGQWLIAGAVAAFWLLHPLHVSTVLYTVQRMTELSSLFVVAGLICYVKGRHRQIYLDEKGWLLIFAGWLLFFPLAVFSKETALLFPVYCSVIELTIFQLQGNASTQKQIRLFHGILILGYVLAALYIIVNFSGFVMRPYDLRDFTISERIYTELRVVVLYLSQILLPVHGKMGFFHDDFTLSTGLFSPVSTLFSALLLIALFSSAALFRKRLPLYAFGILFFFAGHALESTIFSLELVYEHRNYLPSLGILIAVFSLAQELKKQRNTLVWVAIIALVGFSMLTWQRADTWGSPVKLYEFMRYAHPNSPRLNLIYVNILAKAGNFEGARLLLSRMPSGLGPEISNLYLDCIETGEVAGDDVLGVLKAPGSALSGHIVSSMQALTLELLAEKCTVPKQELLTLTDHLLPLPARSFIDTQTLFVAKARILESMGQIDAALDTLESAQKMRPERSELLYFSAHTLSTAGRLDDAALFLTAAYEVEKTNQMQHKELAVTVYLNVGEMYAVQEQFEESLAVFSEGILSVPKEPRLVMRKIDLLIHLQRYAAAWETLSRLRTMDENFLIEHQFSIERMEKTLLKKSGMSAPTIIGH